MFFVVVFKDGVLWVAVIVPPCCFNKEFYFYMILSSRNVLKYIKSSLFVDCLWLWIRLRVDYVQRGELSAWEGNGAPECLALGNGLSWTESSHIPQPPTKWHDVSILEEETEGQRVKWLARITWLISSRPGIQSQAPCLLRPGSESINNPPEGRGETRCP